MSTVPPEKARLLIRVVAPTGVREVDELADRATTLGALTAELVVRLGLPGGDWAFLFRDAPADPFRTVGDLLAESGQPDAPLRLVLALRTPGAMPRGAPMAPPPAGRTAPPPAPRAESVPDTAVRSVPLPVDEDAGEAIPRAAKYKQGRTETEGKPLVTRRATVRYYSRMNPDRVFPLLVLLSEEQIREIVKKAVKQAQSAGFRVEEGSAVEVEPILPGCDCHPAKDHLPVRAGGPAQVSFWVVPHVLGRVSGARVVVRQGTQVLAEIPLDIRVARQTVALVCGLFSLAAPYLMVGLRALRLDPESQQADGFPVYQAAGRWLLDHLRPEWLGFGLLGLAVALYFWARPRKRDVFWDVSPTG